jgi:O-antigen ligase
MGFSIPLLGDAFLQKIKPGAQYSVVTGLRMTSLICVSSILGYYYKRKWGYFSVIAIASSIVFSVLGAGRGIFYGIAFALCLYMILIKRSHIVPVLAVIIAIVSMIALFSPDFKTQEFKYGRVFALEGGIKEQDRSRYYNFLYMFEVFRQSPIIGKGIGFTAISHSDDFFVKHTEARELRQSIENSIMGGSHGSYMSIASTFGLGGIFFISVMVFGTIYHSYRLAVRNDIDPNEARMALFAFIYASIMSVHMITGGDGTNYRDMWFIPGIIAGLMAKERGDKPEAIASEKRVDEFEVAS